MVSNEPASDIGAGHFGEIHWAYSDEDADSKTSEDTTDMEHAVFVSTC